MSRENQLPRIPDTHPSIRKFAAESPIERTFFHFPFSSASLFFLLFLFRARKRSCVKLVKRRSTTV